MRAGYLFVVRRLQKASVRLGGFLGGFIDDHLLVCMNMKIMFSLVLSRVWLFGFCGLGRVSLFSDQRLLLGPQSLIQTNPGVFRYLWLLLGWSGRVVLFSGQLPICVVGTSRIVHQSINKY